MSTLLHALGQFFGLTNSSGGTYLWWSGVGSDIGEVAIFGAVIGMFKHGNCHVKGCWSLGRHPVEGTPYKVCRKHHPAMPAGDITAEHVKSAHARAGNAGFPKP